MSQPPRGLQLRTWLQAQRGRNDAVSDFADDVIDDPDWPKDAESLEEILGYLQERGASENVLDAAQRAWGEFEADTGL